MPTSWSNFQQKHMNKNKKSQIINYKIKSKKYKMRFP